MQAPKKLFLAVLVLLMIALAARWYFGHAKQTSRMIAQVATMPNGTVMKMESIARFPWDRVFIFGPYTTGDKISQTLGFKWGRDILTSIENDDGINLVVFTRGKRVACWFEHPRRRGDFADTDTRRGYTRNDAIFEVQLDANNWCTLVHRSEGEAAPQKE